MKKTVKSYAKVNLHLAVGEKRSDNFHSLQSIFAKIDLFDTLVIEANKCEELLIKVDGLSNCSINGEDTITKAIRLWCEKLKVKLGVKVNVEKRIPLQAGLGGGSSNAASALLAMNSMFQDIKLSWQELMTIALKVGSDVPFFLYDTTFAYVEGRGEVIYPLNNKFDYNIFLVKPNNGVSTKGAFSKLSKIKRDKFKTKKEIIDIFNSGIEGWINHFYNDFELVIKSEVLDSLREVSSSFSLMSGSGSTCYIVCNKGDKCNTLNPLWEKNGNKFNTFSCVFLDI